MELAAHFLTGLEEGTHRPEAGAAHPGSHWLRQGAVLTNGVMEGVRRGLAAESSVMCRARAAFAPSRWLVPLGRLAI